MKVACAEACGEAGVRWEWCQPSDDGPAVRPPAVAVGDLLVFHEGLPVRQKDELMRLSFREGKPAVLISPSTFTPPSRALLVDQGAGPSRGFLCRAATLCRRLDLDPVVLTVGRSERAARRRQDATRHTLVEHGLHAYFDLLVTSDIRTGLACVARWRNCQLIVVPREEIPHGWRWLLGSRNEWTTCVTEFSSFLSLPCAGLEPDNPATDSAPAPGVQGADVSGMIEVTHDRA